MKSLFSNRVFVLLMLTDFFQQLGIWVRNMALLYFVMEMSGNNPMAVSLLTVIEYFPIFLFAIIGGVLADRFRPKQTMFWGDLLSAVSIAIILAIVSIGYWQAVFVVTAISAIITQFSQPASLKMIKRFIPEEQMKQAIAISQTMLPLFLIIGPVIGTFIYEKLGIYASLGMLIILFIISVSLIALLPGEEAVKQPLGTFSFVEDLKEGLQYVKGNRNLLILTAVFSILGLGVGLIQPLEVFIITDRLGLDKENLQWFTALSGVGMLIGSVIAIFFVQKLKGKFIIVSGLIFFSIALVIEGLSIWPVLTGTMRFLSGLALAFMQTVLSTFMVTLMDEKFIGRANGLIQPLFTGCLLIGTSIAGVYMMTTSLITVFITASGIFVVAAFISLNLNIKERLNTESLEIQP
jgi:MFS family permease